MKIAAPRKVKVSALHHPAIQSLALPFMLAAAGVFILRALPGAAGLRWAPLGAVLGLLAALAVLPGFDWPATARAQKLPWIVLAGAALSVLSMARFSEGARAGPGVAWLAAALCWAGSSGWMAGGGASWVQVAAIVLAGALVLALLSWGGPLAVAALTVAALGLTALAGSGGSLLLAQLALMLATVTAVPGLWAWWRPSSGVTVTLAALMPLGLAGLSIAQALPAPSVAGSSRLALLALALVVPPLLSRTAWAARHPRRAPLAVALLAAVPVALALAWQIGAGGPADVPGAATDDDAYYTPQWQ